MVTRSHRGDRGNRHVNILEINEYHVDVSAVLLSDGELVVALEKKSDWVLEPLVHLEPGGSFSLSLLYFRQ